MREYLCTGFILTMLFTGPALAGHPMPHPPPFMPPVIKPPIPPVGPPPPPVVVTPPPTVPTTGAVPVTGQGVPIAAAIVPIACVGMVILTGAVVWQTQARELTHAEVFTCGLLAWLAAPAAVAPVPAAPVRRPVVLPTK